MTRLVSWLLVVVVFGAFSGAACFALRTRFDAGKEMPAYSVYSRERNGMADAAQLLRQLGWEPVAVTRPIQYLGSRGPARRLLILVEPQPGDDDTGLNEADVRGLLRFVEAGNTLLLVGRHATPLHRELGVSLRTDAALSEEDPPRDVAPDEAGGYTDDIDALAIEGVDVVQATQGIPLWRENDRAGAVVLFRGKGRVLVVPDPSLLTRRGLRRKDNAVFLYNVAYTDARDGRVYFDEYHHGIRSGGGFWAYLRYHGQLLALLPLLLAGVVAFWGVAVRLGPAVPQPPPVRADAVDYASALARIYERTGARRLLARGLARDFVAALTRHLRLRRNALPAEVLATWRERHPGPSADVLQNLLRGASELRKDDVSERRLLLWTRAFDEFIKAV